MVIPGAPDGGLSDSTDDGSDGDGALTPADRELVRAAEEQDDEQSTSLGGRGSTGLTSGGGETVTGTDDESRGGDGGGGIDAGEPISGVDGQGSPRDDSVSSPVEGSDGTDGMGGGIDRFVPDDTAGGDTSSGGGETVSGGTDVADDALDTDTGGTAGGGGIDPFVPDDPTVSDPTDDETVSGGTDVADEALDDGGALTPADRDLEQAAGMADDPASGGGQTGPDASGPGGGSVSDGFVTDAEVAEGTELSEAQADELRDQLAAANPGFNRFDIAGLERAGTQDGQPLYQPVFTEDHQQDVIEAQRAETQRATYITGLPGTPGLVAGAREGVLIDRIADANPGLDAEDIQSVQRTADGGVQPVLTPEARLERAREDFELERDPQRLFSGTEQVPLYLDEDDFQLTLEDGQVTAELTEGGRREFEQRQAEEVAPFVDPFEDQNRAQEFLAETQRERMFGEQESGAVSTAIAESPVPFSDRTLLENLEAGGQAYRDVAQDITTGAGDFAAQTSINPEAERARVEGFVGTGIGIFNVPGWGAGGLRAAQELEAAEGNPEATAGLVAAGGLMAAQAGESAIENPNRAAGSLAGGLVGGVAAGRALTRAASTARGVRIRARGGQIYDFDDVSNPPRTVSDDLPAYTQRAEGDADVARAEFEEQARGTALAETPGRPTAGLRVDADSGPLTVSDDLRQAIDDAARAPGRRAVAAGREAQERAVAAARTARDASGRAAGAVRRAPQTARDVAVQAPLLARDAARAFRAEARNTAIAGARTVAELPATARARARRIGERYDQRVFDAGRRVGERLGDLDDAAFQAGYRVGDTIGTVEALPGLARARASQFGAAIDDTAFQAGVRTGEAIDTAVQLPGRARGRVDAAVGAVDDAAFQAGVRTGEFTRRAEDRVGGLMRAGGDVELPSFDQIAAAGRRRAMTARQRVADIGSAYDARVEALGVRTGERLAALDDAAFRTGYRVGDTIDTIEDLPDLTLELDYRQPRREPVAVHARDPGAVREFGTFGQTFEAPGGSSELPGLFQSADLSPLRIQGTGESGGIQLGFPRLRSSRILAEKDVELDITEGTTRQEVSEFLEGDASRARSYIRTDRGGGPTPEQEVIAPPGSTFRTTDGIFGVRAGGTRIPFTDRRIGGEIVPGRMTRRVDTDDTTTGDEILGSGEMADETTQALSEAWRRQDGDRLDFSPTPGSTASPMGGTPTAGSFGAARSVDSEPWRSPRRESSTSTSASTATTTAPGSSSDGSAPSSSGYGVSSTRGSPASSVSSILGSGQSGASSAGSPSGGGRPVYSPPSYSSPGSSGGAAAGASSSPFGVPEAASSSLSRFDSQVDRKEDEAMLEFMGESQQFTVPIADPEDVVDVGGEFDLGV